MMPNLNRQSLGFEPDTSVRTHSEPILYHYTTQSAFLNIIQHSAIWLSSRWHLNDSNEGEIFNKLAREYARHFPEGEYKIEEVISSLNRFDCFISCFSTESDMLSQWRGYANDGKGVSIGFKSAAMKKFLRGQSIGILYPVTYADRPADLGEKLLRTLQSTLKSDGTNPSDYYLQSLAKERWAVKSKAFCEEKEYRLLLTPDLEAAEVEFACRTKALRKFRATETEIRNYYELPIPADFIENVVLGPKNASNLDVVKQLLTSSGFENVSVTCSNASYR